MSKINTTQVTDTIKRFCNEKEQPNQNTYYNNLNVKK